MHVLGDTSAFVDPAGQLLLTRRGKIRMDGVGIVFEFYIAPLYSKLCFRMSSLDFYFMVLHISRRMATHYEPIEGGTERHIGHTQWLFDRRLLRHRRRSRVT